MSSGIIGAAEREIYIYIYIYIFFFFFDGKAVKENHEMQNTSSRRVCFIYLLFFVYKILIFLL